MTVPACHKNPSRVPNPVVLAAVNATQNLSCESNGQPLDSCLWGHSMNGTREVILIDDNHVVQKNGSRTANGLSYVDDDRGDLDLGKCVLTIESLEDNDYGLWSCTLISKNSTIFTGAVHVGK